MSNVMTTAYCTTVSVAVRRGDVRSGCELPEREVPRHVRFIRVRAGLAVCDGSAIWLTLSAAGRLCLRISPAWLGIRPAAIIPAATVTPTLTVMPAATPSPLSPGQQQFVSAVRSALASGGYSNISSDHAMARVGIQLCLGLKAGLTRQAAAAALGAKAEQTMNMSAVQVVDTAIRDICPTAIRPVHHLSARHVTRPPAPTPTPTSAPASGAWCTANAAYTRATTTTTSTCTPTSPTRPSRRPPATASHSPTTPIPAGRPMCISTLIPEIASRCKSAAPRAQPQPAEPYA